MANDKLTKSSIFATFRESGVGHEDISFLCAWLYAMDDDVLRHKGSISAFWTHGDKLTSFS